MKACGCIPSREGSKLLQQSQHNHDIQEDYCLDFFVIIILLVPTYCEINICSKREISGNASQIPKLMKKFTEVVSKNFRFFLRGETLVFLPEDCHWPLLLKSSFYLGAV